MQQTRNAWWDRARWYFLLYVFTALIAVAAPGLDYVLQGWRLALFLSACAAFAGTAGTLSMIIGKQRLFTLWPRLEQIGYIGIVAVEIFHGIYTVYLAVHFNEPSFIACGLTHVTLAIAVALAYHSRPVRERKLVR